MRGSIAGSVSERREGARKYKGAETRSSREAEETETEAAEGTEETEKKSTETKKKSRHQKREKAHRFAPEWEKTG